jgi:hypothetical protein
MCDFLRGKWFEPVVDNSTRNGTVEKNGNSGVSLLPFIFQARVPMESEIFQAVQGLKELKILL